MEIQNLTSDVGLTSGVLDSLPLAKILLCHGLSGVLDDGSPPEGLTIYLLGEQSFLVLHQLLSFSVSIQDHVHLFGLFVYRLKVTAIYILMQALP